MYRTDAANTTNARMSKGAGARPCVVIKLTVAIDHAVIPTIVVRRMRRLRRSLMVSGMIYRLCSEALPAARISSSCLTRDGLHLKLTRFSRIAFATSFVAFLSRELAQQYDNYSPSIQGGTQ